MPKRFLLDTNVFLRDANALYAFQEHDIYIPLGVIDEIDKFKKGNEDYNRNARSVNRMIRALQEQYLTSRNKEERKQQMKQGLPLGDGFGKLFFLNPEKHFEHADPEILYHLERDDAENPAEELCLVTNDTGLQIKAYTLGYAAEAYRHDRNVKDLHELLDMPEVVDLPAEVLLDLRKHRSVILSKDEFKRLSFFNNQYLHVDHDSLLLKYISKPLKHVFKVIPDNNIVYGIMPKNKEQRFLLDLCLDDSIKIGTVLGKAGTGKTLLTLAAALHKVLIDKDDKGKPKYERVIISRPVMEIGQGLGFLPGDIDEKFEPYKGPIYDAAEVLFEVMRNKMAGIEESGLEHLIESKKLQFMPLTYIRGRNLARSYIIIDEAQNLTPSQAKTLATRTGYGSKMIFQGDPYQIDAPHLDETNNGLVTLTKNLLSEGGENIFGTAILKKTERSEVAELVARLM